VRGLVEKPRELDSHTRQRDRIHGAAAVHFILVRSVGLPAPGSQRPLVRMDPLDLEVAAPLVLAQLLLDVVVAG